MNLEYNLFKGNLSEINADNKCIINTLNQYSFCIAEKDPVFKQALLNSDILLPDGIGITFFHRMMTGEKISKIAGADLHAFLLNRLNEKGGSCFYLGSSNATLKLIEQKVNMNYPNIKIGSFSPPFKSEFTDSENAQMIAEVNAFKPDVLFIGMTAPKQEKWLHHHKHVLEAKSIGSIGAVFDFYAGTVKRPSEFWVNLGLEWFIRLIKEPKRMWRRYIYYGPIFIYYLLKSKLSATKSSR